jgi:hypothetical protein
MKYASTEKCGHGDAENAQIREMEEPEIKLYRT